MAEPSSTATEALRLEENTPNEDYSPNTVELVTYVINYCKYRALDNGNSFKSNFCYLVSWPQRSFHKKKPLKTALANPKHEIHKCQPALHVIGVDSEREILTILVLKAQ